MNLEMADFSDECASAVNAGRTLLRVAPAWRKSKTPLSVIS